MGKKAFFAERTVSEVKTLHGKREHTQRNLVRAIESLDPKADYLEIRASIIPGRFYIGAENSAQASRKCFKHGELIALSHPQTKNECDKSPEIPLAIRARDFEILESMREEDINFVIIEPSAS